MGWQDALRQKAQAAIMGTRQGAHRAYERAKVAHGKYTAYQEEAYTRKLAAVRKQRRLVQEEAKVARAQYQKKNYAYGTSQRMEDKSLAHGGYKARYVSGDQEGRIRNNMDRQGGYQGGYKQYGGEAPLFARPKYTKEWWE